MYFPPFHSNNTSIRPASHTTNTQYSLGMCNGTGLASVDHTRVMHITTSEAGKTTTPLDGTNNLAVNITKLILMILPQSFPPSMPRVTCHRVVMERPMPDLLRTAIWSPETKTMLLPTVTLPHCPLVLAKSRAPREVGGLCPRLPVVLGPNLDNSTVVSANSSHATIQQHKTSLP